MLFRLGQVYITPGAQDAFATTGDKIEPFLSRHVRGDWGDLDNHDRQENNHCLQHGCRLLSAYRLRDNTKVWIITEADRSSTTILLPSEY